MRNKTVKCASFIFNKPAQGKNKNVRRTIEKDGVLLFDPEKGNIFICITV